MKRTLWIVAIIAMTAVFTMTPAWSEDQPGKDSSITMPGHGKMMGHGMRGGMEKGMMHEKKMQGGMGMMKGQRPACPASSMKMNDGLMMQLHNWMKQFMAHRQLFDLSSQQMDQLDNAIMGHLKNAIQNKADIQVQMIELRQMLRQVPMDLNGLEGQLNRIADLKARLQLEGLRLYSELMNMLEDQQREKVIEIIGTPFPAPWEKMFPMSENEDDISMETEEGNGEEKEEDM